NLYKAIAPNGYTYLENYLNGTDPNLTARTNSTPSIWAALSSRRRLGDGLNIGLPAVLTGTAVIQRREILLSPSTDLQQQVGGPLLLAYPETFSAAPLRKFESNTSASLTSNWKEPTQISHID
ncbi:MAG: hypothetical protein JWO71_2143, partial [Candidatus Acidoferrum typicum]|nr:hypothetical protein [Candidatus Acidoferrum typicum]